MPGEKWQADHKIALINGGENRESNLFPALIGPHKEKTKADVAEKARIASMAKKHIGATTPTGTIKSAGFAKVTKRDRPPLRVAAGVSEIARRYAK